MGTSSRRCRSRAKAPVAAGLSAGKSDQDPATASAGLSAGVGVALNTRTGGLGSTGAGRGAASGAVARAIRSAPVTSQTSPMSTWRTVTVFFPTTTSSVGTAEAGRGIEIENPATVARGRGAQRLAGERDLDFLARVGAAPYGERPVALQYRAILEGRREHHVRAKGRGEREQQTGSGGETKVHCRGDL